MVWLLALMQWINERKREARGVSRRLGASEHLFTIFMIVVLECIGDVLIQQHRVKCKGVRRTKKQEWMGRNIQVKNRWWHWGSKHRYPYWSTIRNEELNRITQLDRTLTLSTSCSSSLHPLLECSHTSYTSLCSYFFLNRFCPQFCGRLKVVSIGVLLSAT